MENNFAIMFGVAALAGLALAAFVYYRWRQHDRIRRVKQWVKDYLTARGGPAPNDLRINCSEDQLWPVLVSFNDTRTGSLHNLRFDCGGPVTTFALLSENEEKR